MQGEQAARGLLSHPSWPEGVQIACAGRPSSAGAQRWMHPGEERVPVQSHEHGSPALARRVRRPGLLALALLLGLANATGPTVAREGQAADDTALSTKLIAAVVVGPSHEATARYLERAEEISRVAEEGGMEVRRVYHPNATWPNVVQAADGANLLVYLGHGNGWPSPYAPFQGVTKNGFGLNPYEGSLESEVRYYGEGPVAARLRLAPSAVVLLSHLCYASGNAEPGMDIPTEGVAIERADNFAAGFLAAGARAVFAYGWQPVTEVLRPLLRSDATMDELFTGQGFRGWQDVTFDSVRTPGVTGHLDPYPDAGYLRSLVGDLSMTAAEFRAGATAPDDDEQPLEGGRPAAPNGDADGDGPRREAIPELGPGVAAHDGAPTLSLLDGNAPAASLRTSVAFSPRRDGAGRIMRVPFWISEDGALAVTVTDVDGQSIRHYISEARRGRGHLSWDATLEGDGPAPAGTYWLLLAPIDRDGNVGAAAEVVVELTRP